MSVESFLAANRVTDIRPGSNGEVVCQCPFCDKPRKFYFNRSKQTYYCFHCKAKGNAYELAQRHSPDLGKRQVFEVLEDHGLRTNGKTKKHRMLAS